MSTPAQALVLDFGGVVTKTLFETHALTEQALGLAPGTLTWRGPFDPADDPLWQAMQRDDISERDYWMARTREVGRLVGEDWTSMQTFVRRARGAEPDKVVRPEADRTIRTLHDAGFRLAILSNELDLFYGADFRERLPLLGLFETIVDATYTKILKPDPRAYSAVTQALALPPAACVFVDDQKRNVDGALAAGMRAVHFDVARPEKSFAEALAHFDPAFAHQEKPMRDINFLTENNAKPIWHPMAHPAEMRANPPKIIMKGEGVSITDIDGRTVLDSVGGLWNVNLGYSCEPIKQAMAAQLDALPYYSGFRGTSSGPSIELAYELSEWFGPDGMVRSFFTSGGSDSVETALRLARQFWKIRGQGDRTKFLALKKGYHGTHFGGASVNGNINFRRNYEPLLPGVFHTPAPWTYRNPFDETDPAKLAKLCARAIEDEIAFQGGDTIAAFIMEPVLGAGGVIVPHESFMPMVRAICDRHEILLISDEVVTGFGRTGAWSGSRLWGVKPDMMAIAKAITSGYFPLGATLIGGKVAEVFEADKTSFGAIGHGYTYSGHPVGCAAALAALAETKRLDLAANAAARGIELGKALEALKARHAAVGDVRYVGLMAALEIVSDRPSKKPADKKTMAAIADGAYEAGVMLRISGNNIILSPPLVFSSANVAKVAEGLDAGLAKA